MHTLICTCTHTSRCSHVFACTATSESEVDRVYQVLKQASDISSKVANPMGRSLVSNEPAPYLSLEKTASFDRGYLTDRKADYFYSPPKTGQRSYSRLEYQITPDVYPSSDMYQHSPPKTYKNRLSDPGVVHLNNAACLGPSAVIGTAASGPACIDAGQQAQRRQQGPLLIRGNMSYSIGGPVPFATNSGAYQK